MVHTEKGHAEHGVDVTNIVAKEETAEAGEGAHEIGLEGHRSLDTRGVGRRHKSRRHDDGLSEM